MIDLFSGICHEPLCIFLMPYMVWSKIMLWQ